MKPEAKAKLDAIVPLLAHLLDGGRLRNNKDGLLLTLRGAYMNNVVLNPDQYSIHIEPRVVYLTSHKGEFQFPPREHPSENSCEYCTVHRFIEDTSWKPDGQRKATKDPWNEQITTKQNHDHIKN